jgi:hypothetical protein|tara:strand:+ start:7543 stop:7698 length:156 start_codon:yes stop_codon:yes gene_type:complete
MTPKHPESDGIFVSEETLKDPKRLAELKASADQAVKALNDEVKREANASKR